MPARKDYARVRDECFRNARDLLRSSDRLSRGRQYGHASALAVLAIEEAAKGFMYHLAANRVIRFVSGKGNHITTFNERDLTQHATKQHVVVQLILDAVRFAPLHQLQAELARTGSAQAAQRKIGAAILAQVRHEIELSRPGSRVRQDVGRLFRLLADLSSRKNLGLYVDSHDGSMTLPRGTTKRQFNEIRDFAHEIVEDLAYVVARPILETDRKTMVMHLRWITHRARMVEQQRAKEATTPPLTPSVPD